MRALIILLIPTFALFPGCVTVEEMTDEDLATNIRIGSKGAVGYGLGYVIEKNPAKTAEITKAGKDAANIIETTILPMFEGASTEEVLRSTVDEALSLLGEKLIKPYIRSAVQLAINVVATKIKLPKNPAGAISKRVRMAIAAFLRGTMEGLRDATGEVTVDLPVTTELKWPE